jgi:NADH:ubiquinone oxidoreductase subunit C
MVTNSHSILARWRNHFSQLLNLHGVNYVRQTEIHTAEQLIPEASAFEVEILLKSYNDTNHQAIIKLQQN